jgi:hypothetical protein
VMPEDITINIAPGTWVGSSIATHSPLLYPNAPRAALDLARCTLGMCTPGAPVPRCPMPGHNWKAVVHDPTVTWLAGWRETVMDGHKYVFLAASSSFKGKSDMAKYDKVWGSDPCLLSALPLPRMGAPCKHLMVPALPCGEVASRSRVPAVPTLTDDSSCVSAGLPLLHCTLLSFVQARRLSLNIDRIRRTYEGLLTKRDDNVELQLATAMWIIDRLALRVGNEKDDDEADTVGCCSLRVEHLKFPEDGHVEMDFLGKDSMRYHQVIGRACFERVSVSEISGMEEGGGGHTPFLLVCLHAECWRSWCAYDALLLLHLVLLLSDLRKYDDIGMQVWSNIKKFCGTKVCALC